MTNEKISPLEALVYLDDIAHGRKMSYDAHELKIIIETALKALEIIKNKEVEVHYLRWCFSLEQYNSSVSRCNQLTQDEYGLLKEVLL